MLTSTELGNTATAVFWEGNQVIQYQNEPQKGTNKRIFPVFLCRLVLFIVPFVYVAPTCEARQEMIRLRTA